MLVKVETLSPDASQVRLFHTSVTRQRDLADVAGRGGLRGRLRGVRRAALPNVTAGDFAILEAGIERGDLRRAGSVLGDGAPPAVRVSDRHLPARPALVGYPVTDEFQHQFLGLVSPTVPDGYPTRRYDDVLSTARPTAECRREGFIRRAYQGADATSR